LCQEQRGGLVAPDASGDTLALMSDEDAAWRDGARRARMSGSGARDGYGSPPWDPADPVPDADDTQAIPGLGAVPPGPAEPPGRVGRARGPGDGAAFGAPGETTATSWSGNGSSAGGWQPPDQGSRSGNGSSAGAGAWQARDQGGYGNSRSGQPQSAFGATRADLGATRNDLRAVGQDSDTRDGGSQGRAKGGQERPGKGDAGSGGKHSKRRRSFWRELPVLIVVALVLALVIKSFLIQAFYIPSASMENTLEIGDRVLINKVVYHLRPIHRGDIVVFDGTGSWDFDNTPASSNFFSKGLSELEGIVGISHDSSIYIKRVIGLPGDHVSCPTPSGDLYVNGVPLSESSYLYPGNSPCDGTFSITVPAGRLWVEGDHRAVSYDSRGHMGDPGGGTIPESGVLGRAFVIIWPPSRWSFLDIPATFEQPKLNASNAAAGGSTATLVAAMNNGTPIQAAGSALPLTLGVVGAIPLTLLQRTARRRLKSRRSRRKA
jgi:signal peptidase I